MNQVPANFWMEIFISDLVISEWIITHPLTKSKCFNTGISAQSSTFHYHNDNRIIMFNIGHRNLLLGYKMWIHLISYKYLLADPFCYHNGRKAKMIQILILHKKIIDECFNQWWLSRWKLTFYLDENILNTKDSVVLHPIALFILQ